MGGYQHNYMGLSRRVLFMQPLLHFTELRLAPGDREVHGYDPAQFLRGLGGPSADHSQQPLKLGVH